MNSKNILLFLFPILFLSACGKDYTPDEKLYLSKIQKERVETDKWYKENDNSPFNKKGKVEFHPLKYFDADPSFVYKSKLYEFDKKDTVIVYGTKGEPRNTVRYGYVSIKRNGIDYKINVYESSGKEGEKYYSIWFTDKTTNETTYGVGRYLNFEKTDDLEYLYTIDFNMAYNPYCAYSSNYSCAIPTKEDYIDLAIEAGEKKFHE